MRFVSISIRNLGRRPLRSSLTALGIAVAIASLIALVGLSRGVERAWVRSYVDRGTHLMAVRKGTVDVLTGSTDERVAERLRRVEGVADVAGELGDLVDLENGESGLVIGWAPDAYLWGTMNLVDGRLPAPGERNCAVAGEAAALALGKKPGDTLRLGTRTFTIVGIARQGSVLMNKSIIAHLPAVQDLLDRQGKVTTFGLRVTHPDDPQELAAVRARLAAGFPDLLFYDTKEVADANHVLGLFRALAWSTSAVALAMALVVVLNTLLMSVVERTHEIGVLSAVGWQPGRVLAMIVFEGVALAAVGSLVGTAAGIAGLHWLAGLPNLRGFIQPEVTGRVLIEIAAATLLLGFLGGLYPAWRATRLNTVDALRHE